jgi:peptide/nickel transport system permease protein
VERESIGVTSYLIRRFLIGMLTLVLITMLIYALIRSMPGDPLTAQEAMNVDRAANREDFDRMREAYGLNKPIPIAYLGWIGDVATGDLGTSITRHQPVLRMIRERIVPTMLLSVTSLLLTYLLAIPLGLYVSVRADRWDERVIGSVLYMLYSLPAFVAALFLQLFLAVRWDLLPLRGMTSDNYSQLSEMGKVVDLFWHSVLPVTCYTYGGLAYYTRFIRANMQEVIRQDYIRTARAKGVPPARVIVVHAFRNTLIPLVTLIGLTLPTILSGSVILEQIFNWPGMGRLFLESISERDYPTVMGLTLMFSVLTLMGQLLSDVMYAVVDPRVTLD